MYIYSVPGTKIKFTNPDSGYDADIEVAKEAKLTFNQTYTVRRTQVHPWRTDVWLKEVEGIFNSVQFKNV